MMQMHFTFALKPLMSCRPEEYSMSLSSKQANRNNLATSFTGLLVSVFEK